MGAIKAELKLNVQYDALLCGQNFLPQGKEYAKCKEEKVPLTFTASASLEGIWKQESPDSYSPILYIWG